MHGKNEKMNQTHPEMCYQNITCFHIIRNLMKITGTFHIFHQLLTFDKKSKIAVKALQRRHRFDIMKHQMVSQWSLI